MGLHLMALATGWRVVPSSEMVTKVADRPRAGGAELSSVLRNVACEGNQSFATISCLLGMILSCLVRNKTQKEPLTPPFLPKRVKQKNLLQKRNLRLSTLA